MLKSFFNFSLYTLTALMACFFSLILVLHFFNPVFADTSNSDQEKITFKKVFSDIFSNLKVVLKDLGSKSEDSKDSKKSGSNSNTASPPPSSFEGNLEDLEVPNNKDSSGEFPPQPSGNAGEPSGEFPPQPSGNAGEPSGEFPPQPSGNAGASSGEFPPQPSGNAGEPSGEFPPQPSGNAGEPSGEFPPQPSGNAGEPSGEFPPQPSGNAGEPSGEFPPQPSGNAGEPSGEFPPQPSGNAGEPSGEFSSQPSGNAGAPSGEFSSQPSGNAGAPSGETGDTVSPPEEVNEESSLQSEISLQIQSDMAPFIYENPGLRSPFDDPTLRDSTEESADPKGDLKIVIPKTPPELYDLSEIKLKGIIWNTKNPKALFELPSGEGHYTLIKGDKIGKNGLIFEIREDEVVIVETFYKDKDVTERIIKIKKMDRLKLN